MEAPSRKLTVPVGLVGDVAVTTAVKVTGWPKADGFGELDRVVVVAALFTTWATAGDVLAR